MEESDQPAQGRSLHLGGVRAGSPNAQTLRWERPGSMRRGRDNPRPEMTD